MCILAFLLCILEKFRSVCLHTVIMPPVGGILFFFNEETYYMVIENSNVQNILTNSDPIL